MQALKTLKKLWYLLRFMGLNQGVCGGITEMKGEGAEEPGQRISS
jgi:hypothetical protein